MKPLSLRSDISPFVVMDVMQAAAEREAREEVVWHLEVGQPGTPAPLPVIDALMTALPQEKLGYTVAAGLTALRESISKHYTDFYDLSVPAHNIIVTSGSSAGFILAFLTGFNKGDRVAVPVPGYPCYRNILLALELVPVDINVNADSDYLITSQHLDDLAQSVVGVIVSSPNNPTGTMYDSAVLSELVTYCDQRDICLVSDEIYHGITYKEKATSARKYSENVIVVNSFSKYFSMTGWRIGWMIVPDNWIRTVERLIQNLFISTSTLSQVGATKAFDAYQQMDEYVAGYKQKRDILYTALRKCGLNNITYPQGAFYIYADVSHLTNDSVSFCKKMLEETGVAITPGVDFDPYNGNNFIRFSFAADLSTIISASEVIIPWFNRR
ncbi:pyridoxal phosphate-dependent aminotransferase [Brenneria uluponensis]|uniref:pyridoxal phosphate-dependent aminotransferase n=1 Tax=Brenneria uluponensis TaxID=3057057 RepID=UPI0028E712B8|nr:aminotransferase class I/II-fold pyridoxal phosphate-dependent enzyme [Brenneria ulupoensis]